MSLAATSGAGVAAALMLKRRRAFSLTDNPFLVTGLSLVIRRKAETLVEWLTRSRRLLGSKFLSPSLVGSVPLSSSRLHRQPNGRWKAGLMREIDA